MGFRGFRHRGFLFVGFVLVGGVLAQQQTHRLAHALGRLQSYSSVRYRLRIQAVNALLSALR